MGNVANGPYGRFDTLVIKHLKNGHLVGPISSTKQLKNTEPENSYPNHTLIGLRSEPHYV